LCMTIVYVLYYILAPHHYVQNMQSYEFASIKRCSLQVDCHDTERIFSYSSRSLCSMQHVYVPLHPEEWNANFSGGFLPSKRRTIT
jgi:hypothetical protein